MAGASAVLVLDGRGKVIIGRDYRGDVSLAVSERFSCRVLEQDEASITPVFEDEGVTYCWVKLKNIYLLALTRRNANATMLLAFLHKLGSVLTSYFHELAEESLRDNFVITYELLDEMVDNGYPQTTEVKVLSEFIKNQAHQLSTAAVRPPTAMTNAVSWRSEGIVHKKNEIFLDVVEKLDLLVAANGNVLRSEILGSLKMKSFLSGMPELKLGLNDKLVLESSGKAAGRGRAIEMEDVKFHQCVRLSRFENDRTISFIPPDGECELMSYRLHTQVKPLIWVDCQVDTGTSGSRLEYLVRARSQFKPRSVAGGVEIRIPVPADAGAGHFKTTIGSAKYVPDLDCLVWSIRHFQGQREYSMTASFSLPSVEDDSRKNFMRRPIQVLFEIPYFTVSGITVRYLKIIEKSGYQALPWVRYITQNGDYQLRLT
ncbi:mu1 adaptin, putative [Eimeria brunetti]|uniref:Mu1 adaptin, putative n=1 Tax=Eimeria brunetti TaxID=51314 RepID=U6LD94_9EIME|nr:mu1 adaptin, putative [Eimeria brunetti]